MPVTDTRRASFLKLVNCFLNTESASFDEVADDQETGSVEAVMAMDPDHGPWTLRIAGLSQAFSNFPLQSIH
jgi:hypothetical protein